MPTRSRDYHAKYSPSETYICLCKKYLLNAYPYLPEEAINSVMTDHNSQLTLCVETLQDLTFAEDGATISGKQFPVLSFQATKEREALAKQSRVDFSADAEFREEALYLEYSKKQEQDYEATRLDSDIARQQADRFHFETLTCVVCHSSLPKERLLLAGCGLHPHTYDVLDEEEDRLGMEGQIVVKAPPTEPELPHYVCDVCFRGILSTALTSPDPKLRCPYPKCHATFSITDAQKLLGAYQFSTYLHRLRVTAMSDLTPPK